MRQNLIEKNRQMAIYITVIIVCMLCLTAASVPLYKLFCAVTGFGGTTGVAQAAPGFSGDTPKIEVVFKVRKSHLLKWNVKPNQRSVVVNAGEGVQVSYNAVNRLPLPTKGTSLFNVTPQKAGKYFSKIECFCFEEQLLGPQEEVDMDLLFFIDPEIFNDVDTKDIRQITLNYTFYSVK